MVLILMEALLPLVATSFFVNMFLSKLKLIYKKKALYLQGFYCRGVRITFKY